MSSPSVRRRLLAWVLLPGLCVLSLGTIGDYFASATTFRETYDQALLASALAIADHIVADGDTAVLALSAETAAVLRADPYDSIYFKVTGRNGRFVAGDSELPEPQTDEETVTRDDSSYRGEPIRVVSYRTNTPAGPATVTVGETLHKRDRARAAILPAALAVDVAEIGVVVAMILLGVRFALKPLGDVETQIEKRSAKDLSPLPLDTVPVEMSRVVQALNRLFQTVRATGEAQRRFLESAAHQLRTPLAGVCAQLELMTREESDPVRRGQMTTILGGARNLAHTTQQLLTLARSDEAANLNWEFAPVDLPTLVENVVVERLAAADAARIDLGGRIEPASMRGVAWLLHEALGNLVNNAIAYTPEGGIVTVQCGMNEGAPFLRVVDTGLGIPLVERDRVMDRFFRASNARGLGSGLGLAIVREVALLHGGTVSISEGPDGKGTAIEMRFPPQA